MQIGDRWTTFDGEHGLIENPLAYAVWGIAGRNFT